MLRKKIEMKASIQDLLVDMAEGNPGGLRVLLDIITKDPIEGFMNILDLDDMNIRGEQIWVGYKDHCGHDLDKFLVSITKRDPEMVRTINKECGSRYTAVTSGASFNR